jgi:hypothetical protein
MCKCHSGSDFGAVEHGYIQWEGTHGPVCKRQSGSKCGNVEFGVIQWKATMCLKRKYGTTSEHSTVKARRPKLCLRYRLQKSKDENICWCSVRGFLDPSSGSNMKHIR